MSLLTEHFDWRVRVSFPVQRNNNDCERLPLGEYTKKKWKVGVISKTVSPSAETRNLRPNTDFRGTNETEFMLIFFNIQDYKKV